MTDELTINPGEDLGEDGVRIYICADCKQIIPIPSEGTPPYKYDTLLHLIEEQHGWPTDPKAAPFGIAGRGHRFAIISVNKGGWDDDSRGGGREKIVAQIKQAVGNDGSMLAEGFGAAYYDVKETYKDDAMNCWKQHMRNPACSDYNSSSKLLQPDTKAERRAAGLDRYESNVHLCRFCPVHTLVMEAAKKRAGLYDN